MAKLNSKAQLDSTKYGTFKIAKIDSSIYYYDLGRKLYDQSKYDSALFYITKSISFNSKSAKAYNGRCACYINKNNYDLALKECLTSAALDSLQASAFFNLGLCYTNYQLYDNVISFFSKAIINNDPQKDGLDIGSAFYERGKAYEKINDEIKAKKDMESAATFKNYNAISWLYTKVHSGK